MSVCALILGLRDVRVKPLIRWVIATSIFVGVTGLLYQLFIALGVLAPIEALVASGLRIKITGMGRAVPRMYSFPGEPGFTALYLLYGFSMALPLALMPNQTVMNRRTAIQASSILGVCLVLTTSTTAYGGAVILAGILAVVAFQSGWVSKQLVLRLVGAGVLSVCAVFLVGLLIPSLGIASAIAFQVQKLMFGAGSGSLRVRYILWSVSLGASSFFGVGVGSHYGKSLVGTIFAETGFIGLITFGGAIVSCIWLAFKTQTDVGRVVAISTAVVFGTSALAKGITVLLFPQVWLAIALPVLVGSSWTALGVGTPSATETTEQSVTH